ncbi:hypothetical protein [Thermodesulforhabdus norvegica]|uniref:Uncharacterized protein n=1 Tax=Thermodesulforhabdus norvegica TaxID=39841 RepID=A0A1I4UX93_9BACT|nr:hypothetical protein [Thermodesulforhabdus norvegica]SFM93561.1 hypothetical protein SAMN05660836_02021 [Thermodesulforhabdus norvegica]
MAGGIVDRDRDLKVQAELDRLRKEYEGLKEKRMRAQAELDAVRKSLEDLKRKAQENYGTSDLEELKALLEKWRSENERSVTEYREHIETIKEELQKIEARVNG